MNIQSYPFNAWVLTPSFAPKQVEITEQVYRSEWHRAGGSKSYHQSDLYSTKAEAVEAGWRKLDEQWSALQKRADAIQKKKVTLTKHSQVKP